MKKIIIPALALAFASCQSNTTDSTLYQSETYTLTSNGVVQGTNEAKVISPTQIKSNYKSPASESFPRLITFKISINQKDNELPVGIDHWLILGEGNESPIITFGELPEKKPTEPQGFLPTNYEYTFRVDMSPVLKQFEQKGYYEAHDGTRIAKSDFKGFYIAGGAEPLSWDWVNLAGKGLELKPSTETNIYTLKVTFNPYDAASQEEKSWTLTEDLSKRPQYTSPQPVVDALFNLSLEEAIKNIEPDSTLRTGAKWGGVWTRDVSYSILHAFAYHEPEVAKISLLKKVKRNRIIQDTGSGGAWPVSSDRTTWALGAWEVYKATGDQAWLETAYEVIKNTLDDDYKTIYDKRTDLYSGESSFLDWREQTYPKWMDNMDIYVSQNLGTNVVHYQAHNIVVEMAKLLNKPYEVYEQRANMIKDGINKQLWMSDRGYYAQYLYGRNSLQVSPRYEALGEALAILFDVADADKAKSIISKSPMTPYGATCIYPQIPNIPPYHNNGIWPFVQAYWNLAAAKTGNSAVLNHGLASIYRAGALFLTNYENMVAENGDFEGTEINSHRMLWSMAGNLAMVHRVFMGIQLETNGIAFAPIVPEAYKGERNLKNFSYREATLDITVKGFGNEVVSFTLDGKKQDNHFFPAELKGKHTIEMELSNKALPENKINLVANRFSLAAPQVTVENNTLNWKAIEGAASYNVYKNGARIATQTETQFSYEVADYTEYTVTAIDSENDESFASEPIAVYAPEKAYTIEWERYKKASTKPYSNFSGKGFVETSSSINKSITIPVTVKEAGEYLIDTRYSNGTGPWNTDNNCAIRSLYVNNDYQGVWVMPQRGSDEWSDWGYSNSLRVKLKKGKNLLSLRFEEWNTNMDGKINTAMLDNVRVIKL